MEDDVLGNENSFKSSTAMKIQDPKLSPKAASIEETAPEEANEEFKMCSPSSNKIPSSPKLSKNILKPSQLSLSGSSKPTNSGLVLRQSSLNPVLSFNPKTLNNCANNVSSSSGNQTNGDVLKFVPLIKTEVKSDQQIQAKGEEIGSTKSAAAPKFVFGQNLQDRVLGDETKSNDTFPKCPTEGVSNGTSSSLLFSSAITRNDVLKDGDKDGKSLSDSAREYEEQRACKRKYEKVEVKTGEEEETNVISMSCKLFAFDNDTSNWQERGRGTLRLNDFETEQDATGSRLVFRTTGSLRVILNTKIWAKMTVEKANEKSIRLTALDSNGEVKVFLIISNVEDTKHLYALLMSRLKSVIDSQKKQKVDDSPTSQ